jgi:hypothetical protein
MFKIIEPEVAGGIGKESEIDTTAHPPIVKKLNYEFDGWLGDDLIESFPCFIVTQDLKEALEKAELTGIKFDSVKVTTSDIFDQLALNKKLPNFFWLKMSETSSPNDFFLTSDFRLVASEKAFKVLSKFKINNAFIEDLETPYNT